MDGVLNSEDDLMKYREKNKITGCILYDEVEDRPLRLLKEIVGELGVVGVVKKVSSEVDYIIN